ncbi:MAG: phosphoribosylformylglycinamidine synthase, partial [Clostridiaceae bacterium]|nr:phosphoribosylformylglycinamidine synthase [Clostridiaceae bacterium]
MQSSVRRIFVEKKKGFDVEAQGLYNDLKHNVGIKGLTNVRVINRYDLEGVSDEEYSASRNTILSEPPVDVVYDEVYQIAEGQKVFAVEYLPGQYDQRADSASQCIQMLIRGERPVCKTAKLIVLEGDISDEEYNKIKDYCINPIETREAALDKPLTLETELDVPEDIKTIDGFITMSDDELMNLIESMSLAMSFEDLLFTREYFRDTEKRDPTITEIKIIDTYWSDHCRHTTFLTEIDDIKIGHSDDNYLKIFNVTSKADDESEGTNCNINLQSNFSQPIKKALEGYLKSRKFVYADVSVERPISLMDIGTIAAKELKKKKILDNLDESDEINACSIVIKADVNGRVEEWLVMFKNETHNHPTEIEPFGGAATCLGGAIRDPLSGRSYVYQAMRITGSGDPRIPIEKTLPGKLPQRKITIDAAAGYSSYGNQVGLATGQVVEIYDENFVAKRMELGAVIGAAPKNNVVREKPAPDDVVILLGGRTGRDGCGGATGSSKEHSEESLTSCGAEVQKGNALTERNIQRLFRNSAVSTLIKKCNDFGAGGVAVAIGELADGLDINLDAVPKKYEGLDGTELAISESQERMAVVVSPENINKFIAAAKEENLEATPVAVVTETPEMKIRWRGKVIASLKREFLNSNGAKRKNSAAIT